MNEKEMEKLKKMLSKVNLLRWVKKYSADKLTTDLNGLDKKLSLNTSEDSVMLMDVGDVKALITDSSYGGKIHSSYDLRQLSEIINLLVKDKETQGTLIVSNEEQNPLVVEYGKDVVVLSPRLETDRELEKKEAEEEAKKDEVKIKEVKNKSKKKDKKQEEAEEQLPDDEEFIEDDEDF